MTCLIRFETTSGTVTHLMCEATEWEVRREVVRIKAEIAKWSKVLQVDITDLPKSACEPARGDLA